MFKNKHSSQFIKKDSISHSIRQDHIKKICCTSHSSKNIIISEFLCHLPMAILALSVSLFLVASINEYIIFLGLQNTLFYLNLFHISHYIHILCASFSSFYSCYSLTKSINKRSILFYIIFAFINSMVFCTISDMIFPAIGSLYFQNTITMHLCLFCKSDFLNATLFSCFGILAGFCLEKGDKEYSYQIAKKVHIGHIWFGCIASILYLFSQITINIASNASILFIILFISILVPCIFSDICLPYLIAQYKKKLLYK